LTGSAIGFWWNSRRGVTQSYHSGQFSSVFLAAYGVTIAASFPFVVQLCLSMTIAISNVLLLTLCRLGLVFAIIAPLGIVWGSLAALLFQAQRQRGEDPQTSSRSPGLPLMPSAVLSGWLFTNWVFLPNGSMDSLVMGLCLAALALAFLRLVLAFTFPTHWIPRLAMSSLTVLLVVSWFNVRNYRAHTSAELLFAAPVFVAHQSGVEKALLTELDEGRRVATKEGSEGTYTLWKYRGVQHQLRQNGLPKGMASGDVAMCPEYSAETLPAVMPLVLHERPDTVLILGMGSGVSITTALAFPTQEVTCAETDPALIELVKEKIWSGQSHVPTDDPRLTILPIDPALMLRSKLEPFDVIVSLPHQVMVAESAACFTEAFYRDASRNLAEHGLFCQRFTFVDFGPDALRVAARTMQSVFRDVVFLEMAGGEMLLLGTNSPQGVSREGFLARLQKQHVRKQLAALGWDWSVPLNLSAFDHGALKKFANESPRRIPTNTLASGILAFRLPGDMMRWGPKPVENQQALIQHVGRFAQWGGIDPDDPDLLRRLAEVTGQRKLMANHPDEYWAYRKTVREQVTQRPRSVIVQAKGELPRQEIHQEDQRRLDYFRALGAVHKHKPHRASDIAKVEAFAEPYDPLMTFFLHQEVAELHSESADRNYAAELAHRVHSVYFAAPQDRSIRNVIAAIDLLCGHAEAVSTPLERWDHLNAMLQMIKQRWAIRAGVNPASTDIMLNDVDKSLEAVDKALKTMDELCEEAGINAEDWQARRQFVENTVIRPLRVYRRQLMPFHQRERVMEEKKQSAEDD
jgi:spermidine synthase